MIFCSYFRSFVIIVIVVSVIIVGTTSGSELAKSFNTIYDSKGVPMVDYGYINGTHIGIQRNPLTIAGQVINRYNSYLATGDEVDKQAVINNADWLVRNIAKIDNYAIYEYKYPFPNYNLTAPWHSALAQGVALRSLTLAHKVSGDVKYLQTAKLILNSFFVSVKDGGVTYKDADGWWYEEYPKANSLKQPRVLNGMMSTTINLYYYYNYTGDTEAKFLFQRGVDALANRLKIYDDNRYSYSYYDALKTTNPLSYHRIHIQQLKDLYDITLLQVFKQYHDRWQNFKIPDYLSRSWNKKFIPVTDLKFTKWGENSTLIVEYFNFSHNRDVLSSFNILGTTGSSYAGVISQNLTDRIRNITLELGKVERHPVASQISFEFVIKGIHSDYNFKYIIGLNDTRVQSPHFNIPMRSNSSVAIDLKELLKDEYLYLERIIISVQPHTKIESLPFRIDLNTMIS